MQKTRRPISQAWAPLNMSIIGHWFVWPLTFLLCPFELSGRTFGQLAALIFHTQKVCGIRAKLIHNHNSVKSKCSTRNLLFSCHVHTVHVTFFFLYYTSETASTSDRTKRFPDKVWYWIHTIYRYLLHLLPRWIGEIKVSLLSHNFKRWKILVFFI
jgi:hypothetical protein